MGGNAVLWECGWRGVAVYVEFQVHTEYLVLDSNFQPMSGALYICGKGLKHGEVEEDKQGLRQSYRNMLMVMQGIAVTIQSSSGIPSLSFEVYNFDHSFQKTCFSMGLTARCLKSAPFRNAFD